MSTVVAPASDAQVGLVALVEEEERDRAGENERAERVAIHESPEAGGGVRAVQRLRGHRATIGAVRLGSVRAAPSLH